MYHPQALGEKVDIPKALKERIAQVQAPTRGESSLPAKSYHFTAAAYSSCFLLRRSIPTFIAKQVALGAVNAYRSSRVCARLADSGSFSTFAGKSYKDLQAMVKILKKNPEYCDESKYEDSRKLYSLCLDLEFNSGFLKDPDVTTEILDAKIRRRLAEVDAQELFRTSKYFESANRCHGEQLSKAVRKFLESNGKIKTKTSCNLNINQERCLAARKLLETYLVDFEWTEAQHLAGVDFAEKNCPKLAPGTDLNQVACRALNKSLENNVENSPSNTHKRPSGAN